MADVSFYMPDWVVPFMERYMQDMGYTGRAELFREEMYPKLAAKYPKFKAILRADEAKKNITESPKKNITESQG